MHSWYLALLHIVQHVAAYWKNIHVMNAPEIETKIATLIYAALKLLIRTIDCRLYRVLCVLWNRELIRLTCSWHLSFADTVQPMSMAVHSDLTDFNTGIQVSTTGSISVNSRDGICMQRWACLRHCGVLSVANCHEVQFSLSPHFRLDFMKQKFLNLINIILLFS